MSYLRDRSRSDEPSSSILSQTGRYLWRHRREIAVGGVVCAAGIALLSYYSTITETEEERLLKLEADSERQCQASFSATLKPGNRSRMLLKIRKQFDFAIKQFLPTIRTKILEVVDVSSSIRKIKELRSANNNMSINSDDSISTIMTESMLWDEIKVSSLTLVYVSAYMVSAVTVLLRVQLHILGKSMESVLESQLNSDNESIGMRDDDVFKILIEGTYKHIFGKGLTALTELVRRQIVECFAGWTVKDKLTGLG
jgi:hypothetical protein